MNPDVLPFTQSEKWEKEGWLD